jgi:hypothetical protein
MERKVGELDLQTVVLFEFLDTPGDEVAPRSDKIGKDFENERLRHREPPFLPRGDSTFGSQDKSKGFTVPEILAAKRANA